MIEDDASEASFSETVSGELGILWSCMRCPSSFRADTHMALRWERSQSFAEIPQEKRLLSSQPREEPNARRTDSLQLRCFSRAKWVRQDWAEFIPKIARRRGSNRPLRRQASLYLRDLSNSLDRCGVICSS